MFGKRNNNLYKNSDDNVLNLSNHEHKITFGSQKNY